MYKCMVVPLILGDPLLVLGHNRNGHNGLRRTYNALKRSYYWPNMKKEVFFHCKNCSECILQNQTTTDTQFGTFTAPEGPMQFICMDIVGPISSVSSKGNRFCLTVIDMLTGYTMAVAIPNKSAEPWLKPTWTMFTPYSGEVHVCSQTMEANSETLCLMKFVINWG